MPQGQSYTYRYPNAASYALLPVSKQHGAFHWQGRSLRHGYIFGYKDTAAPANAPAGTPPPGTSATYRQIDYENYKMFQFNPPAVAMSLSMMPTDDPDSLIPEGNAPYIAVGLATSGLELFFDRTEEIARSTNGVGSEIWRDLGVQVDLFDFLKVISGGETSRLSTYLDAPETPAGWGPAVQSGSLNQLSGLMFDAAITGSSVMFRPFAVVFNPNMAIHVSRMTSFTFTYLRFTSDLVPTSVKLEIGLEITNMGTKAYTTSAGTGGPTGAVQGSSTGTAPPAVNAGGSWFQDLF